MRGALWVYGLPLVLLFIGALLGSALAIETVDASAIFGMAGLFLGFAINRVMSRRAGHTLAYQPRLIASGDDSCQAVVIKPASQ